MTPGTRRLTGALAALGRTATRRVRPRLSDLVVGGWERLSHLGAIGPESARGRRFGALGEGSVICFPASALYGERWMQIGHHSVVGPYSALSVGMSPEQVPVADPVLTIGDRCLIGRGSSIVAHLCIEIGDDVWTGPGVYITDQNHGYRDVSQPISSQPTPTERPVRIGAGSWLGTGVVVLPGVSIGRHVVVAAGSIVTHDLPDDCVAAGSPAVVIRHWDGQRWVAAPVAPRADT